MAEDKKATTRVTAAQVNEKVDALAETVEELSTGIGSIVEMLTEERAAKKIAEARAEVEAQQPKPKRRKASVGDREGDVIVRNLHPYSLRVRIGKESDPYRINLEPRGQRGDQMAVPASLRNDLNYKNNLGRVFEEITDSESDALRNQRRARRLEDAETTKHRNRTVVTDEQATVRRMEDQTPEDRLNRVGPRYKDVPGSNNPSSQVDVSELTPGVDAEADVEYRMFLQWRKAQQAARAGGVEPTDFSPARTMRAGRDVVGEALNVRGGDELSLAAQAMARYIKKLESGGRAGASEHGVIPKGELSKPVTLEHATVSVQPNVTGRPKRRY